MATKEYTSEFAKTLQAVTAHTTYFIEAFGGTLQVADGIKQSETFMQVKESDTDVVINKYSTDENVGFGTGTGSSSRFGQRREIKSVDKTVPYKLPLAINEGIDDFTVNDIPDSVVAERQELHAIGWGDRTTEELHNDLVKHASETLTGTMDEKGLYKLFNTAYKKFFNNKVSKTIRWIAYVTPDVKATLIDSGLATMAKNVNADAGNQELYRFKNFDIIEVPETYLGGNQDDVIFTAFGVGVAGVGVRVARAFESEDFAGTALQSAGKLGTYLPEQNKIAIIKAEVAPVA